MRKLFLLLSLPFLLISCTIHRNIAVIHKTEGELTEYYASKGISDFLLVKDYASLVELNKIDHISIPENIVFDADGYEIVTFDEKLCANYTEEFLKKYNTDMELKKTTLHIDDYLKYLKSSNDNINIEDIKSSKKIRVFANTATYATLKKRDVNQEAWDLYNNYRDKFDIYIVNLDLYWDKASE
jgi:hypothetical protein